MPDARQGATRAARVMRRTARKTVTGVFQDLIRTWESNLFTPGEFGYRMMDRLRMLPPAERDAALEALSAHADERVREVAAEFRVVERNEKLSKDFDYVVQHSPLRPGVRLELSGGYDYLAEQGKPRWLNGRDCYKATFLGFVSYGENTIPAGLVEFDEVVDVLGHKGRYGVLLTSYGSDSVAWSQTEDVAEMYVIETLPEDPASIRSYRACGSALETHATYCIEATR